MRTITSRGVHISLHRRITTCVCAWVLFAVASLAVGCGDDTPNVSRAVLNIQEVVTFPAASEGVVLTETVRVFNGGDGDLVVFSVQVDGPQGAFSQEGLDDLRLAPGDTTFITITYAAQSSERARGEIVIESNGGEYGAETYVYLETTEPLATLVVSPNPLDFGRVPAGLTATETVSLLNLGNIYIDVVEVFPLDPSGEFCVREEYLAELPRTLGPNEEWTVEIEYTPSNDNRDETPLQVEYRVDGSSRPREEVVTMIANGAAPCIAVSHEDGFFFGPSPPNETREKLFTVTNCSSGDNAQPLYVSSLDLLDTPERPSSESFELINSPTLPAQLPPGDSFTFYVTYTATQLDVSDRSWLEIVSNDEVKSPLVIEIGGIGGNNTCPRAVANCVVRGAEEDPAAEVTAELSSTVDCSADGSTDPDGDIVGYTWTLTRPESSSSELASTDETETSFVVDAFGTYTISLNVIDDSDNEACAISNASVFVEPESDIAIELFWNTPADTNPFDTGDGAGTDVDLHLIQVDQGCWNDEVYDCHWRNPQPDWGVVDSESDNPVLDVNDTDGWGPENITLSNAPEGTYRVGVEYFDDKGFGPSTVTVHISVRGEMVLERTLEMPGGGLFWDIAEIEWPSGAVVSRTGNLADIESAQCDGL